MSFYATEIPSWTYEDIQVELQHICIATTLQDNGYEQWLLLWHRINRLDDLRAASPEQITRFNRYALAIFNGMEQARLH
jgi:hypothetical protein